MSSTDPKEHRQRERQFADHVERLLSDDRLRVETTGGRRMVAMLRRDVRREDHEVELTRLMGELEIYDRELRAQMPVGRQIDVNLLRTRFLVFKQVVGRLKAVCVSPARELLEGSQPRPMNSAEVKDLIAKRSDGEPSWEVPTTVVVMSTGGFAPDALELVERRADRTLILVEPHAAGGWTVHGPPEAQGLTELFDPEVDADKRKRVRETLERKRAEILHGGIAASQIAADAQLPLQLVEEELKEYARGSEGLVAKRLDGSVVLFRDGSVSSVRTARSGGSDMPFMQRMKSLFSRKGENERKVTLLSERRATLSLQRDRSFDEMGVLEQKEAELRQQFRDTSSTLTKKRVTSQLVQLRKDLERRQQLLGMLNQQINVVSTHLHNVELVQQGQSAELPTSEDLANDAAAAEEVLAELQASNELAGSVGSTTPTGLTEEEQALFEELERESAGPPSAFEVEATAPVQLPPMRTPRETERERTTPPPIPATPERRRGEAEAG